jgi:membrane protein
VYGAFASVPLFLLWIYLSWVVVLFGAVAAAVMPEWRERAAQTDSVPGSQFLDALQILRILWEAHRTGDTVTGLRLHAAVKLPIDRIEAALDTMSGAHWVGKVGRGWALIRDAAEISVADVYHLFVFRAGARLAARQSGQELDRLALELAGGLDERLQLSVEELFLRSAQQDSTPITPKRFQAV